MQEFVWLGKDLRDQSVLVKVFDVENFPLDFVVLIGNLIDIGYQVLVLEVHPPELLVVVSTWIVGWWLLHEDFADLAW